MNIKNEPNIVKNFRMCVAVVLLLIPSVVFLGLSGCVLSAMYYLGGDSTIKESISEGFRF